MSNFAFNFTVKNEIQNLARLSMRSIRDTFYFSFSRYIQCNVPSLEKVWYTCCAGRLNVLFAREAWQSKFPFIGSRRGLVTNDTLFCRHPAGDKDRGIKINCKTKNKQSKKHDAGQGIGWGARRGRMDATTRGGARFSAPPRFSGFRFRPGKRKATACLRLTFIFLLASRLRHARGTLGKKDVCERCV